MTTTEARTTQPHRRTTRKSIPGAPSNKKTFTARTFHRGHVTPVFFALHMVVADRIQRPAGEVAQIIRTRYGRQVSTWYVRELAKQLRLGWRQYVV